MSVRATVSLTVLLFSLSCAAGWLMQPGHSRDTLSGGNHTPGQSSVTVRNGVSGKQPSTASAWRMRLERDLTGEPLGGGRCSGEGFERLYETCSEPGGMQRLRDYATEWIKTSPSSVRRWVESLKPRRDGSFGFDPTATTFKTSIIFESWAALDEAAALRVAEAVPHPVTKGQAVLSCVMRLAGTDPERARSTLTKHIDLFKKDHGFCLPEVTGNARQTVVDFLSSLPPGESRGRLLHPCFTPFLAGESADGAMWNTLPAAAKKDVLRVDLHEHNSLGGLLANLSTISTLFPDTESLQREMVESGTPDDVAAFLAHHGRDWAQRDLAAAVQWTMQHLKGSQSINEVTGMFRNAAATNFEQARQVWETLPDGSQKARALWAMRSGVSREDANAVKQLDAMIQSLPPGLREIAASPY